MKTCSEPECGNVLLARGWCRKHYLRWYKHGDPQTVKSTLEGIAKAAVVNTKHGLHNHPLYPTWHAMMRRCYSPENAKYTRYGARGIRVCDRWHDIRLFVADLHPRPVGMSLDRFDNDGPYSPENCRWATPNQQARNRPQAKLTDEQRIRIRKEYEKTRSPSAASRAVGVQLHDVKNVVYGKRVNDREE